VVCKAGAGLCSAAPAPSFLRFAISRKLKVASTCWRPCRGGRECAERYGASRPVEDAWRSRTRDTPRIAEPARGSSNGVR